MRPLTYFANGTVLGHYAVAQKSGALAATIAAAGHLARIRWTDATRYLALMRLKVGVSISGAVTTATEFAFKAILARGFTVDFTTKITSANMQAKPKTGAMRSSMSSSLMGTAGPGIAQDTVMSGQTLTEDADAFATTIVPMLTPVTATGTAVALPVGAASNMVTLYEWTGLGQHPIILAQNEGVLVQTMSAGPATGTFNLHTQWEWAEILSF